jgi:hypothetical protein
LAGILFIRRRGARAHPHRRRIYTGATLLLYGGIAVAVCLILLLVLGLFF